MKETPSKAPNEMALIQLLPNMLTITAICAGLSAIRAGFNEHYELAVQLIIVAAILDGLDGRLARALGSSSKMGAELDSLADFLNFGVAPGLVLYFWVLDDMPSAAWIAVLVYVICAVIRLARFNVSDKTKDKDDAAPSAFFTGVPSPAGALLVMLPLFLSFAFANKPILPGWMICLHMVFIGYLMISRIPTWSFKRTKVSRSSAKFVLVGFAVVGAAVVTNPWITLVAICLSYVMMVIWALVVKRRSDLT